MTAPGPPVPFDQTRCPTCAGPLGVEVVDVAALFRHGGHVATRSSVVRHCRCGWSLLAEVGETRPRR